MANKKITDLTEDTTPADNDWVETVDVSAGSNKKVSRTNFFINPPLGDGSVDPEDLVTGTGTSWPWTSWTPTNAGITVGNGTINAKYKQIGKTVSWIWTFTLGSTSAVASGNPNFTLPVAASSNFQIAAIKIASGCYYDTSSGGRGPFDGYYLATDKVEIYRERENASVSGDTVHNVGLSSTVPITWATGDIIHMYGTYEAA